MVLESIQTSLEVSHYYTPLPGDVPSIVFLRTINAGLASFSTSPRPATILGASPQSP